MFRPPTPFSRRALGRGMYTSLPLFGHTGVLHLCLQPPGRDAVLQVEPGRKYTGTGLSGVWTGRRMGGGGEGGGPEHGEVVGVAGGGVLREGLPLVVHDPPLQFPLRADGMGRGRGEGGPSALVGVFPCRGPTTPFTPSQGSLLCGVLLT